MSRRLVAAADAWFQPDEPRLTGTKVSTAFPSLDTTGPATCAATTPDTWVKRVRSAATFARSALVRPDGRS